MIHNDNSAPGGDHDAQSGQASDQPVSAHLIAQSRVYAACPALSARHTQDGTYRRIIGETHALVVEEASAGAGGREECERPGC